MNENESLTVTLTLENDEELECAVLTIFETDGRRDQGGRSGRTLRGAYGNGQPAVKCKR